MKYEFKGEPGPWILGGCSGRMITTPTGYVGDGFIADVDTKANALLISKAPEMFEFIKKYYTYLNLRDQKEAEILLKSATEL